jgi:DNA polymerase III subunit delta'
MFENLIGNDRIKKILGRFVNEKRVPNAVLFAGPDGVGKKQFALEVAKSAVCNYPKNGGPCGECQGCKRVDVVTFPKSDDKDAHKQVIFTEHPDVGLVIPYGRNILVDAIRGLEREANFRPYEASARFFIIDNADKMNDAASNALLKTLEEPPSTTHIFLITSRPDSLLPTIRSRCQTLRFGPVEVVELEKLLLKTHKYSQTDARLIASYAQGSVAEAMSIDLEEFRARRNSILRVLRSVLQKSDVSSMLRTSEEMAEAKNKEYFEDYLNILQSLIRDVWMVSVEDSTESVINSDIQADLKSLAEHADRKRLSYWLQEVESLRGSLDVNINKRVATDALFVKMAA